jgi:hypothetical protein
MHKIFLSILVLLLGCSSEKSEKQHFNINFELPFDEGNEWIYATKYLNDDEIKPGKRSPMIEEKIKIVLQSKESIGSEIFFAFSRPFNRLWHENIVLIKNKGYQNYYAEEEDYLLKYPIKLGQKWKNKIPEGYKVYEYTNVDTTISINDRDYLNCIELTIKIGYYYWDEGDTSKISMYLNKDFGLIYYFDHSLEEEYKLLKFEDANKSAAF